MSLATEYLEELTGTKRVELQRDWLKTHGFCFEVDRQGRPKVLVDHVREKMGATVGAVESAPQLRL